MEAILKEKLRTTKTDRGFNKWVVECRKYLKLLRDTTVANAGIGTRQKHFYERARIQCMLLQAQRHRNNVKFGAGSSSASGSGEKDLLHWEDLETSFRCRIASGMVVNSSHIDPRVFLKDSEEIVYSRVKKTFDSVNSIKINFVFIGEFVHKDIVDVKSVTTKNIVLYKTDSFSECFSDSVIEPILKELEEFQERDSGWALKKIVSLIVNINFYNPMRVGCNIILPKFITQKKAVVNVYSEDNACFAWAIVAALFPARHHVDRCSSYPHYRTVLNCNSLESFPITLKQVRQFEMDNDVSINVFTIEERRGNKSQIVPLQLTKLKRERHVNLLLVTDTDEHQTAHFVWIKDLSRLVSSQFTQWRNKKYICDRCLHYFHSQEKLLQHTKDCTEVNKTRLILPSVADRWIKFKNHKNSERVPFVVYADIECLLKKIDPSTTSAAANTHAYQKHEPFSVGYCVKCCRDETLTRYNAYRGVDCVEWFARQLKDIARVARETLRNIVPMQPLSEIDVNRHYNDPKCHVCEKPFLQDEARVRDHDHMTGRYRGPAHSVCNLNYKDATVIPVIFHNLAGYDAHFIIEAIANSFPGHIELLPINKEKYISFTKYIDEYNIKLRFIDSFKFMASSLDKLSSYLEPKYLKNLKSQFSNIDDEQFYLLTRKGIFPYDYVDDMSRLEEMVLPSRDSFYNKLNDVGITDDAYNHALKVWARFNVATLGEYSDLYLKTDVLLLADVFENFRDSCMENYKLDPAHYYTLPGFTWDAMLKHTDVTFELLTDIDMMLFVERGIRGGLSQCSHRYEKANNKYMTDFDPEKPSKYIMYFDINNLYGWAMCQPLPTHGFQWIEDAANFNVMSISEDSSEGYILEVDLEYPHELHDSHADLPFCPIREIPPGMKQEKLLATVADKTRYVIHYRTLQQCIRHGLVLKCIHRGIRFQQSTWLHTYIDLNTQLRTNATNDFEKNLFKLMNNAVFGKTMENVRNRVDVRLVTKWEGRYGAEALISKPNFHSRAIFNENLVAIEFSKLSVKFDKPIYVGMCILDISKTCLYNFHYDYMQTTYGSNCKILYTDTDSLIYSIECPDVYEIMKKDYKNFDTSEYPLNNIYNIPSVNKKIPGIMKDENNGRIMTEFVGLRAKMYSFKVQGSSKIIKKAKGVKGYVIAKNITFNDYKDCLDNFIEKTQSQNLIRSRLHKVYSIRQKKIALSPHDDKRSIVLGTTSTLPWGHYKIKE